MSEYIVEVDDQVAEVFMRKNIIEWEFRRGNESRKMRFEVECTLEEFAEFLDVIEPFGDEWARRLSR